MTRRVHVSCLAVLLLVAGAICADEEVPAATTTPTATSTMTPTTTTTVGADKSTSSEEKSYPLAWASVNFKSIVDNDRLYKKYKDCLLDEHPQGCPRDVLEFKKFIPEALETMCSKCLPAHIDKLKEAIGYICEKRKEDFDEVLKARDPDGAIRAKFEEKYGKLPCD